MIRLPFFILFFTPGVLRSQMIGANIPALVAADPPGLFFLIVSKRMIPTGPLVDLRAFQRIHGAGFKTQAAVVAEDGFPVIRLQRKQQLFHLFAVNHRNHLLLNK